MKKIGAIIALATVVTIGGAYATWSYAGKDDVIDVKGEMKATMEDATYVGSFGTYHVISNFQLKIDQEGTNDYDAVLKFVPADGTTSSEGFKPTLTITFTPNENTGTAWTDAIPTWYTLGTTTTMQYTMDAEGNYDANGTAQDVFKLSAPANSTQDAHGIVVEWAKQENSEELATKTWTDGTYKDRKYFYMDFTEEQIKEMIQINAFNLDTKTEYDEFAKVLTGNISLTVTDGTLNTTLSNE